MHARSSLSGKSIFCSREGSPRYRRFFLMRFGTRKAWASIGFTLQQTASGSLRVGISLCRRGKLASMVSTCKSTECQEKNKHRDRKSTRLNSSHPSTSYAVVCLKKQRGSAGEFRRSFGVRDSSSSTREQPLHSLEKLFDHLNSKPRRFSGDVGLRSALGSVRGRQ